MDMRAKARIAARLTARMAASSTRAQDYGICKCRRGYAGTGEDGGEYKGAGPRRVRVASAAN